MSDGATLPFQRRSDLQEASVSARGVRKYTMKDPLTARFFQLGEEEYFILQQLDSPVTWRELVDRLTEHFAPRRFTALHLEHFLHTLVSQGLVRSTRPGMGQQAWERAQRQRRRERLAAWSNPLAIRCRGWNPSRLIDSLQPWTAWLFSWPMVILGVISIVATLLFVAVRFEQLVAALPELHAWLTPQRATGLAVAVGLSKILHEIGHAIACHRMGGKCRELGVMFLAAIPCLYCNVSDMWLEPNKWRRMAVSAAGIWVELLLAVTGFWLWWMTPESWVGNAALALTLVCSLNTVLFNGNPLLRYDGYHLLADYLEIPNLYTVSRQRLASWAATLFGDRTTGPHRSRLRGRPDGTTRPNAPDRVLIPYAVLSIAYRCLVVFVIWRTLCELLAPAGLTAIGHMLLLVTLAAPLAAAAARQRPPRHGPQRRKIIVGIALAAAGLGLLLLPLPGRVNTWAVLLPAEMHDIRVLAAGRLTWHLPPHSTVTAGQTIASLDNQDFERRLAALRSQVNAAANRAASLEELQFTTDEAKLLRAQQVLRELQLQMEALKEERKLFDVRASRDGVLLPASPSTSLATPNVDLLDEPNQDAEVRPDDLLGSIADLNCWEAVAAVPQTKIDLIATGQRVWVAPHGTPGVIAGEVVAIAEMDQHRVRQELIRSGAIAHTQDELGNLVPTETWFETRIRLHECPKSPVGGLARVRFQTTPRSVWRRLRRSLAGLLATTRGSGP